ncbi:hypothetical protein ACLMAJ_27110 [Nocardia sp. KC 131]|uniref:hypothetical protein n=1 Tax=Nocardia arseniciresistens TaxID=3392119 RepID=UPI00398F029C
MYEIVGSEPQRVAEFRLTADGSAELTLSDEQGCPLAERWYNDGIKLLDEAEYAMAANGPAFMRALLQPFRMSYCFIVDESSTSPSPWPPEVEQ